MSSRRSVRPEGDRNLKSAFSSLIDAMRDSQRLLETENKIRKIEATRKSRLSSLDNLQSRITKDVLSAEAEIGKELVEELERHVSNLSRVAIDLIRKKVEDGCSTELEHNQLALESERAKTFKDVEAFLATLPILLIDKSIELRLQNGMYIANARFNSANNIQFEFSLDCKGSPVLNKEFKLASSEGEIRVPVAMGKSWHKKEPVPDYEGLHHYVLSTAEVTENTLAATYVNPQRSSAIIIVDYKRSSHVSLTVEYILAGARVNITAQPALSKFLDSEQIEKSSEALWQAILDLENHKIDLVKLVSDGRAVFEEGKLDLQQFLTWAWGTVEPEIKAALRAGSAGKDNAASDDQEVTLNRAFVRQKIMSLGEDGKALLAAHELS